MIEILIVIGYLILGIFVGFIAGAFGIGGGVVMVPSFLFLFEFHGFPSDVIPKFAIGTSLFASVLASSSGAFTHLKNQNLNVKLGIIIGSFAVLSGFFLSLIAVQLNAKTLKLIFAIVLILVTVRLLLDKSKDETYSEEVWKYSYYFSPLLGVLIGALSAFAGVGGGIIAVPILHYLFKIKFKNSIGTSNLIIIFSALSAAVSYVFSGLKFGGNFSYTLGFVFLLAALPTGLGTMISARWGANFTHRSHVRYLKILFAFLIIVIDVKILFDVFGQ